ncbi:ABC transporter family substrate-binding protein [Nonomuraea sp. NPDC050536]|uniref:ABC transporter family substrate-binding protein n=1 Tax=Nonomuraea sp. NPDC050536 TaxID=3364366 RepID=UPI0037C98771
MKVRYRVAAGAAILAMAASACGGGGADKNKPNAQSSQQAQKQAAELPGATINEVAYDQVKQGGTVQLALTAWHNQWNYHELDGTHADVSAVIEPLMPTTMLVDDKGTVTNDPNFISEYKMDNSSGKQVVTYKINEKAVWSDGKPISAQDFISQWKALNGSNKKFKVSSTEGYDKIADIKQGATEKDVIVTFSANYPDWTGLFAPLYPASTTGTPDAFNKGWATEFPVTAGPFKVDKVDQTAKTLTLVPNDKWWGRKAKLDKIIFRVVDSSATTNAFANGELDAVEIPSNSADLKRAKEIPGADIRKAAAPFQRHFTVNGTSPMLQDVKVRQAVSMGINRDVISQSDLKDMDWPVQTLGNHFYVNTQKGYQDNTEPYAQYHPDKSKQMLDEAGWKMDGDFRKKDGKVLTLRCIVPNYALSKQECELAQAMLKEVGVKVDVQTVSDDDQFPKYITPGNFELAPFTWLGTPYPISSTSNIYKSIKAGVEDPGQNFARVGSPEIDAKMDAAKTELDPAKAIQLTNEADKMIWEEVHTIMLYQRPEIYAAKKALANYGAFGFKSKDWTAVGFTG